MIQTRHRIDRCGPAPIPKAHPYHANRKQRERRGQRQHRAPEEIEIAEVETLQQIELLFLVEAEHEEVPLLVETVPSQKGIVHEPAQRVGSVHPTQTVQARLAPERVVRRQRGEPLRAVADTVGRDDGRRVLALPATAFEPDLGPGVRVGLTDGVIFPPGVHFAALVADDDARGHPGGAHQRCERRGVMFAEPLPRTEEEIIERVVRRQRSGVSV